MDMSYHLPGRITGLYFPEYISISPDVFDILIYKTWFVQ